MSSTVSMSPPAWPPARRPGSSRPPFTDNAVGLIHTTGPKLRSLAPLVPVLRELITRPDTPLDAEVKEQIIAQLDSAARRFAVIGH